MYFQVLIRAEKSIKSSKLQSEELNFFSKLSFFKLLENLLVIIDSYYQLINELPVAAPLSNRITVSCCAERERERHKKRSRSGSPGRGNKHRSWSKDRGSRSREKRSRSRDRKSRDRRSSSRDHKKHRSAGPSPLHTQQAFIVKKKNTGCSSFYFVISLYPVTLRGGRGRKGPADTGMCLPLALNTSRRCNTKLCKVLQHVLV